MTHANRLGQVRIYKQIVGDALDTHLSDAKLIQANRDALRAAAKEKAIAKARARAGRRVVSLAGDCCAAVPALAGLQAAVAEHNATHPLSKRGIAVMPVCFGISFTKTFLNQAGALVLIYAELKWSAHIQSRVGPWYVSRPWGWAHPLAEAVKFLQKEDLVPDAADDKVFRLAPYVMLAGTVATFVVIPIGPETVARDLDLGIFYLLAFSFLAAVMAAAGAAVSAATMSSPLASACCT